mmetsp:Transcript_26348/g.60786  ORF Transcript_26348/g.60786 Transcript_26348/m.60786 type:complete len:137 (+) Transcript_26348:20-430(+)
MGKCHQLDSSICPYGRAWLRSLASQFGLTLRAADDFDLLGGNQRMQEQSRAVRKCGVNAQLSHLTTATLPSISCSGDSALNVQLAAARHVQSAHHAAVKKCPHSGHLLVITPQAAREQGGGERLSISLAMRGWFVR